MRRSLAISAITLAALCAAFGAWADDTESLVGESVGENLYDLVDKGGFAVKDAFAAQALEGSAKELNALIKRDADFQKKLCGAEGADCRVFTRNVNMGTVQDALAQGTTSGLIKALNPAVAARLTSEDLAKLFKIFAGYAAQKRETVAKAASQVQSLSMIGLYVDGDLDNSDYDIVADIEKINTRLFSKPPVYLGPTNRSHDAAGDLVSGPFQGGSNIERPQDAASSTGFAYKDAAAEYCPAPAWAGGLVDEVNVLLAPQGRDGWGDPDPMAGAGLSTSMQLAKPNLKGDCGDMIFCINIEFLTYQQKLLGRGGHPKTVEDVVEKHLAHAEKQSAKSFAQSKHATNFGQLGLAGNLKKFLLDNLSFKVEVNMLPPPFLASKGLPKPKPEPPVAAAVTAAAAAAGGDMSVVNLVMDAMKAKKLGADPDRFNQLFLQKDDLAMRTAVAQTEGLDVAAAAEKLSVLDKDAKMQQAAESVQETAAQVYVANQAAKNLNANLLEISSFTSAFKNAVDGLTSVIASMAQKK